MLEPPGCRAIGVPDIVVEVLGEIAGQGRGVMSLRRDCDVWKHRGRMCRYGYQGWL